MGPFLHVLQNSAFSAWVVGSDSIWAYPMILTMHTIGLGIVVGAAVVIDLRLLGVGPGIPLEEVRRVFPIFWLGFTINLISGVMLFISEAADKATQPVFLLKLGPDHHRRRRDGSHPPYGLRRPRVSLADTVSGAEARDELARVVGWGHRRGTFDGVLEMNVEADLKVRLYDARIMDPFSAWLEATRISTVMRDTTWLWPACESIHFIGLALLIGGAGYFDLRLLGFMRRVPMAAAKAFMPWAIMGFAMNFMTGTLFFVMAPHMYVPSAAWWAKVFFIVVAGLNAMLFETTLGTRVLLLGPNEDTPISFRIVGGVSLFSWFAVLFFGRMLPYIGTGN